jgi:hypothetical protein
MRPSTVDFCCFISLNCLFFFVKYLVSHLFLADSFVPFRSLLKCHLLREGIGDHSGYCLLSTFPSPLLFHPLSEIILLSCLVFVFQKVTFNDFEGRRKYPSLRKPGRMPCIKTQKSPQSLAFLISRGNELTSLLHKTHLLGISGHEHCPKESFSPSIHLITTHSDFTAQFFSNHQKSPG